MVLGILLPTLLLCGVVNAATISPRAPGKNDRLDCWLSDDPANQTSCSTLGCLWDNQVPDGVPWCFFPKADYGYKMVTTPTFAPNGFSFVLDRLKAAKSRFGEDAPTIKFDVEFLTEEILHFKFSDPSTARYEVPVQKDFELLKNRPAFDVTKSKYDIQYQNDDTYGFRFQVRRKSNNVTIFNTEIGGLTFSDQFLQLASYLPSSNIYGIGENTHPTFQHDLSYKTWPLFARDVEPTDGSINVYGVHPFYTCLESNAKSHGVFLLNSNAMEFTMMPSPAMSVRTIGGVLDFFVFVGENPEHVVQLYTQLIGRPFMPPYWSLGFQLCRWGYTGLQDIQKVINRTREAQIPQDVQYSDIDYMDQRKDFTWDKTNFKGMDQFMMQTKENGLRWILILDPAVLADDPSYAPYNQGLQENLFIHWPTDIPVSRRGNPPDVDTAHGFIYGLVWPNGPVAFPDFFRNGTRDWWKRSIASLYQDLKFDGLWIDMNEPSNFQTNEPGFDDSIFYKQNFNELGLNSPGMNDKVEWHLMCPQNKYDDPAYLPLSARVWGKGIRLSVKTLCMASVQGDEGQFRHYDVHSLYGLSETEPTIRAARDLTGERSLVFSRSTYPSSGRHGGHWLGDNDSRWVDLHRSIIGMLEFNLFGIPYIGADICGFNGVTTPEMCHRWLQLGAFYPLSRNHNVQGSPDQDPAALGPDVAAAARRALNIRYKLLPYLYTLFFVAHVEGSTVISPLFHHFSQDPATYSIDRQFMWGPAFLISPALDMGQTEVVAYLPNDVWYNYHTGIEEPSTGGMVTISDLTNTPLHVRGGYILPSQDPALNTKASRQNPFSLLVYPKNGTAAGELFWDDGQSQDTIEKGEFIFLKFQVEKQKFTIRNLSPVSAIPLSFLIRDVIVYGSDVTASTVFANGHFAGTVRTDPIRKCNILTINLWITKDSPDVEYIW